MVLVLRVRGEGGGVITNNRRTHLDVLGAVRVAQRGERLVVVVVRGACQCILFESRVASGFHKSIDDAPQLAHMTVLVFPPSESLLVR